jgi:hypothetical protein
LENNLHSCKLMAVHSRESYKPLLVFGLVAHQQQLQREAYTSAV